MHIVKYFTLNLEIKKYTKRENTKQQMNQPTNQPTNEQTNTPMKKYIDSKM